MTVLLLNVAMRVVEARVDGLSIGRKRPARNFDHLAVTQIRFLDRSRRVIFRAKALRLCSIPCKPIWQAIPAIALRAPPTPAPGLHATLEERAYSLHFRLERGAKPCAARRLAVGVAELGAQASLDHG
jgi:hypothetical protein